MCVCVCVCVCLFVVFCHHAHLDPKYMYVRVHRNTKNYFIYLNRDFRGKCFVQKLQRHLLALNATNYS